MAGLELLATIIGSVALLLWGVRMVRTGVTRTFSSALRRLLGWASANRVRAFLTGVGVTGLLQSSTAAALLLSSFAGRGLVTLPIAIAIMLGADVGTTIVAQAFSLNVRWLWAPFIALGFVAFKSEAGLGSDRAHSIGRILIGLGLMLLALTMLSDASGAMRQSATIQQVLASLASEPILAVLVAAVITWAMHSSLAMVLLVMSLAGAGLIAAPLAIALVLGANLGSAFAPYVALAGSLPSTRRVALANLLVRGAGVIVLLPFLSRLGSVAGVIGADAARVAINFHTLFNLGLAIAALPFIGHIGGLATRLLPDTLTPAEVRLAPQHLDPTVLDTPSEALACAMRETLHLGGMVLAMLRRSLEVIEGRELKLVKELERSDDEVDRLHEAIKLYLIRASKIDLGEEGSRRYVEILTFTTNLEHIGDIIDKNLMELAAKKIRRGYAFSAEGAAELRRIHSQVVDNMRLALNTFATRDLVLARQLLALKTTVRSAEFESTERHFSRIKEGRTESIETSSIHLDIIRDLKRINSHLTSVAYPILEAAGELAATRLKEAPVVAAAATTARAPEAQAEKRPA